MFVRKVGGFATGGVLAGSLLLLQSSSAASGETRSVGASLPAAGRTALVTGSTAGEWHARRWDTKCGAGQRIASDRPGQII
jgi:hypothetical protein